MAKEIGASSGGGHAEAAQAADLIFLTVPWVAVDQTLAELGDLTGKVLIDVTNPYVEGRLHLHEESSDAEEIQRKAPAARVVKGWNTIFASVADSGPDFDGRPASVFLAGDDPPAKQMVSSLARDMGYDPVDCGPLTGARDLEKLLGILGTLGHSLEWGTWALKVLKRGP